MIERRRKRGLLALLTRGHSKLWSEFLLLLEVEDDKMIDAEASQVQEMPHKHLLRVADQ